MTTTDLAGRPKFDLGRVTNMTFKVISANLPTFMIAALVLVGIPGMISGVNQPSPAIAATNPLGGINWGLFALAIIWSLVGSLVLQAGIINTTIKNVSGISPSVQENLSFGLNRALPLFALSLVVGIGVGLGMLLLIVPGLTLSVMWAVASPAVIVEKKGVFDALGRSRELTKGSRWSIFGLVIIYVLIAGVVSGIIGGIGGVIGGMLGGEGALMIVIGLFSGIASTITGVIGAAGVAAIYYELRSIKEGIGPEQLASVFD